MSDGRRVTLVHRPAFVAANVEARCSCAKGRPPSAPKADLTDRCPPPLLPLPSHIAAARSGHQAHDACDVLLSRGADIDAECKGGRTPLLAAIESNCPSMIKWLLGKGADPRRLCDSGWAAIHLAVRLNLESCVLVLLQHVSGRLSKERGVGAWCELLPKGGVWRCSSSFTIFVPCSPARRPPLPPPPPGRGPEGAGGRPGLHAAGHGCRGGRGPRPFGGFCTC